MGGVKGKTNITSKKKKINQHVLAMCMQVKRKQENQKKKKQSEGSIIKDIRNIFRLKKENKAEYQDTE